VIKVEAPPAADSSRYFGSLVRDEDLAKKKADPPPLQGEHNGKFLAS
jgi:hypothetical protein